MILYSVCYDAQFELEADIKAMEEKHNIRIVNVTDYYIKLCKCENREYRGPNQYLFIGDWPDLLKYFTFDYFLEDIEQVKELIQSIKPIEI